MDLIGEKQDLLKNYIWDVRGCLDSKQLEDVKLSLTEKILFGASLEDEIRSLVLDLSLCYILSQLLSPKFKCLI